MNNRLVKYNKIKMSGIMLSNLMLLMGFCQPAIANCIVTATPVNFGNYTPLDGMVADSTGTVTVTCSPGNTAYSIGLDGGLNGAINNRKLRGTTSSNKLFYNVYIDASRNIVWGNGSANSQKVFSNNNIPITVYGRINRGQNAAVGQYSDTLTITVDF